MSHNVFKFLVPVLDMTTSTIGTDFTEAESIRGPRLIDIDEVTMIS